MPTDKTVDAFIKGETLAVDVEAIEKELSRLWSRLSFDNQIKEGRGDKPVCCEQITLAAKGQSARDLPGIVTPLIIGDLPVVLWWQDDLPEEDVLFERLLALKGGQIIMDSTAPFPDFSLARLVAQELDRTSPQSGRDQIYESALSVATQLI